MDGIVDLTTWKTLCCNAKIKYYQSKTYPYDSGKECSKCGRQWSELQISRGEHLGAHLKKGI